MSLLQWAIVLGAVGVGAVVHGTIGFGMNLIAAPVVALVDPRMVPVPLLVAGLLMALLVTIRERDQLELGQLRWAVAGRVPGDVVGAVAVVVLAPASLSLVLAGTVLLGVALSVVGLSVAVTRRSLLCIGTVCGVMGTATSVGGPPIALLYQHGAGPRVRAMLSSFLLIGSMLSLVVLTVAGVTEGGQLRTAAVLSPAVVGGFAMSAATRRFADRGFTRPLVLAVSALAAVSLAVRALV